MGGGLAHLLQFRHHFFAVGEATGRQVESKTGVESRAENVDYVEYLWYGLLELSPPTSHLPQLLLSIASIIIDLCDWT